MTLIPEWRDVWRWYSTWVMAGLAAMPAAWAAIPAEWRATVPDEAQYAVAGVMFIGGVIGRVVKQGRKT